MPSSLIFFLTLLLSFTAYADDCHLENLKENIKGFRSFDNEAQVDFLAKSIVKHGKKNNINCLLMATILKIESDYTYRQNSITPDDISIAQINYPIQKRNLARVGIKLHRKRLLYNDDYAIEMMAHVLSLLKQDYPNDPFWFTRYNSNVRLYRLEYLHRLEFQWKKIKRNDDFVDYKAKQKLLKWCVRKYGWKRIINIYTPLATKAEEDKAYKERFSRKK